MIRSIQEKRSELLVGRGVRIAVFIAAAITFTGGILRLLRDGAGVSDCHRFQGEPHSLTGILAIMHRAASLDPAGVIQLGVLALIAIPILRVTAFGVAFLLRRDWIYSIVALIILCILLFSLLSISGQ